MRRSVFTNIDRRRFLGRAAGAAFAGLAAPRSAGQDGARATLTFRPEQFGARGDSRTDDTAAFQALGSAVSQAGGGKIVLRAGAVYRLGRQVETRGAGEFGFVAQPMLLIEHAHDVIIEGNGATLRLNDGLRYGAFNPVTGRRFDPPAKGKFTTPRYAAVVGRMVELRNCTDVRVVGLVLDGNMDRLVIGGRWGDTGIQLPATGLQLTRVSRAVIEDVQSSNHGLDGVYLLGRNTAREEGADDRIVLRNVRCDRNGRQGMSIVGGRGMRFERCAFTNTAQGPIASRPRAGVDIEPNGRNWASDTTFVACEFINNRGVGLLADTGNSRDLTIDGCTFWQGFSDKDGRSHGSGDALWLGREGVRIVGCQVHGNVTHMPPSAQISGTGFDDAVHARFGRSAQVRRYLLDSASGNFDSCTFAVTGGGRLGLIHATPPMTLRGCRFTFAGSGQPTGGAVAVFASSTTLHDVAFGEKVGGPDRGLFIADNGARLSGDITVAGPRVRWHRAGGPVGVIR